jgi:peptidoglycan/xylan/chitin deacetylase (PgdA/CDA1 family)
VLGRDEEYVILLAGPGDTLRTLAARYLGTQDLDWIIGDFNGLQAPSPGQEVVIPLGTENPVGVYAEGYQTIPILCYHRFGTKKAKMVVTATAFAEQMAYLVENGYRVVRLPDLVGFLEGGRALPRKAVAVTIDDGYKSAYQVAYPILKRYGLPATIFVYTDFIGTADGLTWEQLAEMASSGLVDLQPHSKSHADLALKGPQEGSEAYDHRVRDELQVPMRLLGDRLGLPMHTFAYPYGDANDLVVDEVKTAGYRLGATVLSGGNGFFAHPYLLRRTMVFGEDDLGAFRGKLEVFRSQGLR